MTTTTDRRTLIKAGAGGDIDLILLEASGHTLLNEHPLEANAVKAFKAIVAFITARGTERHAQR